MQPSSCSDYFLDIVGTHQLISHVLLIFLLFKLQHSIHKYTLFHGYLDESPKYSLPSSHRPPRVMVELKPSVRSVDICHHGNEIAVVLEGENLWFCHQVTVGGHHELLPAQKATASSIQFNIPRKDGVINVEGEKVIVSLHSHFFKPNKEAIMVNVEVMIIILITIFTRCYDPLTVKGSLTYLPCGHNGMQLGTGWALRATSQ